MAKLKWKYDRADYMHEAHYKRGRAHVWRSTPRDFRLYLSVWDLPRLRDAKAVGQAMVDAAEKAMKQENSPS